MIAAAVQALDKPGVQIEAVSAIRNTPAVGPAGRSFANAALVLTTGLAPPELLRRLKLIEVEFGRRRGRRWGPRVLDLDIILWSGGMWSDGPPTIPHPAFRTRRFVLDPLAEIAPDWRDPVSGASLRQLLFRLGQRRPRHHQKQ